MKHSSIEKMNINIAPVQVVVEKQFLTDELDIWSIKMTTYDYKPIRSKINAEMHLIFDKETGETYTDKAWFKPKEVIEFNRMVQIETEFNTACDIAKQYLIATYIEIN